ncbi:MAG: PDZ domain-containing protein [Acidobacteria bacterium]|nr:PDZ domain-containing protein [Acidobacteriota bacterium]
MTRKSSGGSLGVYLGDINEERAKELRLTEARGALVGTVEESSPAAKAGLQVNDVILTFNNQPIFNPTQLFRLLSESAPGTSVTLGISRGGASLSKAVTLGQRRSAQREERLKLYAEAEAHLAAAEEAARAKEEAKARGNEKDVAKFAEEEKVFRRMAEDSRAAIDKDLQEGKINLPAPAQQSGYSILAARYQLGVRVTPLTGQLATFFNVKNGVLVNEVRVGGAAEQAGIKAGDCITAVNGEPVDSLADLNRLVDVTSRVNQDQKAQSVGEATLNVMRERTELSIKVKFTQR